MTLIGQTEKCLSGCSESLRPCVMTQLEVQDGSSPTDTLGV